MVSVFMNDDEEPQTQAFVQTPFANDIITNDAPAVTGNDPAIHARPTRPAALAHEALVDAPVPLLVRAGAWLRSIAETIATAMRRPRFSDNLPPVPVCSSSEITHDSERIATAEERAEAMLLELMRAPPEYVDAAIVTARAARALRKRGDDVFAEGFVVFALSRMLPDDDGTVSIKQLREQVREIPTARGLMPVLLRLEEQGVLAIEMPPEAVSPSGVMHMDHARVRLLVVP